METVIIGANGVIGSAVFNAFSTRFPGCVGLTTKNIPLLKTVKYDLASLRDFIAAADAVIYCVGVSKFAECEQFPEKSLFLNAQLPKEILGQLSANQIFVYFSSPVVLHDFSGAAVPLYTLHKRVAEEELQQNNVIIFRPSKVIESANIIREWKAALEKGEKISVFSDQSISPISAISLTGALLQLLEKRRFGAYNFSARDRLSYLDLAKALCACFELDPALIEGKSAMRNNPFFLDQDVLDYTAAEKDIGYIPPFSKDVVQNFFKTLA
jgi:dTDP-4-dehydrorhamnose reductase